MQPDDIWQSVNQIDKYNAESFINWYHEHFHELRSFYPEVDVENNKELLYMFSAYIRTSSIK